MGVEPDVYYHPAPIAKFGGSEVRCRAGLLGVPLAFGALGQRRAGWTDEKRNERHNILWCQY